MTVGGTQVLPSVDTDGRNTAVRQVRRCAAVQTPMNCHCQLEKHSVGDVEPVKFAVQYRTQAAVKLPSAGGWYQSGIIGYCMDTTRATVVFNGQINDCINLPLSSNMTARDNCWYEAGAAVAIIVDLKQPRIVAVDSSQ